jgi:hypothetical protein
MIAKAIEDTLMDALMDVVRQTVQREVQAAMKIVFEQLGMIKFNIDNIEECVRNMNTGPFVTEESLARELDTMLKLVLGSKDRITALEQGHGGVTKQDVATMLSDAADELRDNLVDHIDTRIETEIRTLDLSEAVAEALADADVSLKIRL